VREYSKKHQMKVTGLRAEASAKLRDYAWPGNVRELRNVVERAVILARSGWIDVSHLPPYIHSGNGNTPSLTVPLGTVAEVEKTLIVRTLEAVGYNKSETARRLGVDVKTIRSKLKAYGIS